MGRREGFHFWFVFVLFHYQEYNVSLVSKPEETDAMVRRQREERAQNWISLNNWIEAMGYIFKLLVQTAPPRLLER